MRHILIHTGTAGLDPPHSRTQPPTLTAPMQPPPGGPGFESSHTFSHSRPMLTPVSHSPVCPSSEAPTLQLGGPPPPLPPSPRPAPSRKVLQTPGKLRAKELEKKGGKFCHISVIENPAGLTPQKGPRILKGAKIKNPNEASSISRIFHLYLTEKSATETWLIFLQRRQR